MKVKLRNLTNEQYKKWGREGCHSSIDCKNCIFNNVYCGTEIDKRSWINHKDLYSDKFLNQEIEIEDEPILDAQEKAYLENVVRPFKNRVINIKKFYSFGPSKEFIIILVESKYMSDGEQIVLPYFKLNEMYRGMVPNKKYTLKELGLFKEELEK